MSLALQKPVVYNAKVVGELAKQVYTKEGMHFPSGEQFAQAQQTIKQNLNASAWKNLTVSDAIKGGVVAAELYVFFMFGEIIGRRNFVGYNVESASKHEH